ncbi:MAG TPA: zinc ribbon domain-containing protein [Anaerolineae bacterium]|nr:zinc ribbon domain-containing protein [Anaerolineae bacterium]
MPTYEYICLACKHKFEISMTYAEYGQRIIHCPHCNSTKVQRRIGRIRVARSEDSHLESLVDPAALNGLEDDPKALGRMMRTMSKELGEDLGPEFDEVVDRLEKGQNPEEIEKELPDLGGDMGGMGGMGGLDDL